jgi:hypothetical protein
MDVKLLCLILYYRDARFDTEVSPIIFSLGGVESEDSDKSEEDRNSDKEDD